MANLAGAAWASVKEKGHAHWRDREENGYDANLPRRW